MNAVPFRAIHVKAAHGPAGAFLATPVTVTAIRGDVADVRADIGWGFYHGPVFVADLARTPREAGEILARKLNSHRATDEKSAAEKTAGAVAR
jgi:hypothetical protein